VSNPAESVSAQQESGRKIYAFETTNHKVTKTEMNKTLLASFLGVSVVESFNQAHTGVQRTKFFPTVP
jgi:hypothetical protein